jgi:hypothetical protein
MTILLRLAAEERREIEGDSPFANLLDAAAAELERLRAERDAVIALSIEQLADGSYLARVPWRKGGYPGSDSGENGPYHFDRHEDAVAAVRRAAGLDLEAAP